MLLIPSKYFMEVNILIYNGIEAIVEAELKQKKEEGCFVEDLSEIFHKIKHISALTLEEKLEKEVQIWANEVRNQDMDYNAQLEKLYQKLQLRIPIGEAESYEPSDLNGILNSRPKGFKTVSKNLLPKELFDKIYGGWLGRSAGCMLGKPVEGWVSKEKIKCYLQKTSSYPLNDYFQMSDYAQGEYSFRTYHALKGIINHCERDDDMDYTLLNLLILEKFGFGFNTDQVADMWLTNLPYCSTYTAERVAYKNLVNQIPPPGCARLRNPYREWIGAQIRADMFGWVSPGDPEQAALLAYKDASMTHMKNGIYGEMFIAAMIAAAFVTSDAEDIIASGLSQIPSNCRLSDAVKNVVGWCKSLKLCEDILSKIMSYYGHYNWVHTINNALIVVMSLLCANNDFEQAICSAVMSGLDTDCNGATVGSIMGVVLGANKLPEKWVSPLNNELHSYINKYPCVKISDMARKTLDLASLF